MSQQPPIPPATGELLSSRQLTQVELTPRQRDLLRLYQHFRAAPPTTGTMWRAALKPTLLMMVLLGILAIGAWMTGSPEASIFLGGMAVGAWLRDQATVEASVQQCLHYSRS